MLRIEGPATVDRNKCTEHTFGIRYSVINNTTEPANGTVRATLNGASLMPVGSAKLTNLLPGKEASGAFTACCPSNGSFTAWVEYHNASPAADNKNTEQPYSTSDSLTVHCR